MQEKYIVTSSGVNKDGKPYSFLAPIQEGIAKSGNKYAFINNDRATHRNEEMTVGLIVSGEIHFSPITPPAK